MGSVEYTGGSGGMECQIIRHSVGKEEPLAGDNTFFIDCRGSNNILPTPSGPLYVRCQDVPLGEDTTVRDQGSLTLTNRCFNCGSPHHMVSHCREPLNPPLISLSRAMYYFLSASKNPEPQRIYEYEERKALRLRCCEAFRVGNIRGELLREALGLSEGGSDEEEYPWYWNMMEWGYPPGWFSVENPLSKVLSHIEGKNLRDCPTAAIIYDEDDVPEEGGSLSESDEEVDGSSIAGATPPKRWVQYPTTLFSSDLLPIYSGNKLPPVGETETREERRKVSVPPWRQLGAFDAFGPAGWQQFIKQYQEPAANFSPNDPEDMDMSD